MTGVTGLGEHQQFAPRAPAASPHPESSALPSLPSAAPREADTPQESRLHAASLETPAKGKETRLLLINRCSD